MKRAHAFVDLGYLRAVGAAQAVPYPDPWGVAMNALYRPFGGEPVDLIRATSYDALPDKIESSEARTHEAYLRAIEDRENCALGFGTLRHRRKRGNEQKGVDTLMAVDMVVGAFTGIFEIAILISGDADFVPVLTELKRRGVQVVVAARSETRAEELRRVADRTYEITSVSPLAFAIPTP